MGKWACPWANGAPNMLWFHFNIYIIAEASNFEFGMQLGLSKAQQKTTPRGKVGVALG